MLLRTLRAKLMLFSVLLALLPIAVAGRSTLRIAQDELKSSINEELLTTADRLAEQIDFRVREAWQAPLRLLRSSLDQPQLSPEVKLALLRSFQGFAEVLAVQLTVAGAEQPLVALREGVWADGVQADELARALTLPTNQLLGRSPREAFADDRTEHIAALDTLVLTEVLPLEQGLAGRDAVLSARIDLGPLCADIAAHPFQLHGLIQLLDADGHDICDPAHGRVASTPALQQAVQKLRGAARATFVYRDSALASDARLAVAAFPMQVRWLVRVERREADAYRAVAAMQRNVLFWLALGILAALVGAALFAQRIGRPIAEIGRVARQVGRGDFSSTVQVATRRDELGELGRNVNAMVSGLVERERVMNLFGRFQSVEVVEKLLAEQGELELGGEQRHIAMLMSDLRGFSALAERLSAEQVVALLNNYFEVMFEICSRHGGIVNDIVGDGLFIIFGAPVPSAQPERDAVACALEMQLELHRVNDANRALGLPGIGIGIGVHAGSVVVGNIGSRQRTKYGVVGSAVNLTSRVESYTVGGQVLTTEAIVAALGTQLEIGGSFEVHPKGVQLPLTLYDILGIDGDTAHRLPQRALEFQELVRAPALQVRVVDGKNASSSQGDGRLLALAPGAARVELSLELPLLADLQLRLSDADAAAAREPFYAKLVERGDSGSADLIIRFTAVPPAVSAHLEALRSPGRA